MKQIRFTTVAPGFQQPDCKHITEAPDTQLPKALLLMLESDMHLQHAGQLVCPCLLAVGSV